MPVVVASKLWRRPVPSANLDDLGRLADLVKAAASAFWGFALGYPSLFRIGIQFMFPPPM